METIKIKVTEKTAREWEQASPKLRANLEKRFKKQIEGQLYKSKIANLEKVMDQIAKEAEANGLTEEILQEILSEDD